MMPENQTSARNLALDGLRGIAILLVVSFHNFGFIDQFIFGWMGVDLFFVLSGFLITGILLRTVGKKHYLKNFFARRVLRIIPLYYLSLLIFLVVLPAIGFLGNEIMYYREHQEWLWLYLQNWLYSFYFTPTPSGFLTHFWSLAVEEQFYLIWPFLVLWIRKPRSLLWLMLSLLVCVIAGRFVYWLFISNDAFDPIFTYTRIDGICLGSILAILHHMNSPFLKKHFTVIVLALAGINFIFYFFDRENHFALPYLAIAGYSTVAALFALLVHDTIVAPRSLLTKILRSGILRFFGRISYGFYIFHWPVYRMLRPYVEDWVSDWFTDRSTAIVSSVILTIIGIAISVLSYYGFERHFLKMKKAFN